ncbi:MAG: 23S rRNA-/tRNA-specific pseudouridylate synthase [Cognaticolwellia sp.]|jgi:23S rRNA-/tRNA-specific pseudouridylate synthase
MLYQDDFIIAVDKPTGLFVHRSYMEKDKIYDALQLQLSVEFSWDVEKFIHFVE